MDPARRIAFDEHRAGCSACAGYDRVVAAGVGELQAAGTVEPSSDFIPRLQHRLYNLDQGLVGWGRADSSGTSVGFVVVLALLIGAVAWLPIVTQRTPTVELPAVLAVGPRDSGAVLQLFRAGPLLEPATDREPFTHPSVRTVFFRYTRLGSNVGYTRLGANVGNAGLGSKAEYLPLSTLPR